MPERFLVVSANEGGGGRLHSDLLRLGGEVVRVHPERLSDPDEELPEAQCVVLDLVGYRGEAGALCEAVGSHEALRDRPVVAVIAEQDLAGFQWPEMVGDLIVVPYREPEFRARMRRALGQAAGAGSAEALAAGEITLDPESYEVRLRGARVDLTLKEYELLKHLMGHPGRVFTRDQLLSSIWGYEYFGGTRTVDVHIRRLRLKLGEAGEQAIQTVRGVGYVFRP